jgi:integrase
MPHHLLTAKKVKAAITEPGKHRDGAGLFLHVHKLGQASWGYKFRLAGKTLWGSIGPLRLYSLDAARKRHEAICRIIKDEKRDPRKAAITMTVTGAAEPAGETLKALLLRYLIESLPDWKSGAALKGMPEGKVADLIKSNAAGKQAKDHWLSFNRLPDMMAQPAQAIDLLAFRYAAKAEWPDNPATVERTVRRLAMLLKFQREGRPSKTEVINYAAMPYAAMPAFMRDLATRKTAGTKALRWTILTGARTDETLGATWREITEIDGLPVWKIPGSRMKAGKEHVVPLTPAMLAIIGPRGADDAPLFHVIGRAAFLNHSTMRDVMTLVKAPYTVHGFRSTFRTWGGECTDTPREVLEAAIAHLVGGTEGAYMRGPLLAKRRQLMEAWCAFALNDAGSSHSITTLDEQSENDEEHEHSARA